MEHGYRMQSPQGCPPALYDIMLECWHKVRIKLSTIALLLWLHCIVTKNIFVVKIYFDLQM